MSQQDAPKQPADAGPVDQRVRPLLDDWAEEAGHVWHDTRYGPATDCTVLRNDLEQLVHAAKAQERERCGQVYGSREVAMTAEIGRLRRALHDIAEEWAGAECGEPAHAQEAYAIGLAKRMYALAAECLRPNVAIEPRR